MAEETIAGHRNRALQLRKPRKDGMTEARRAHFLDHLAATCNVQASADAAGVGTSAVYRLRRRDPAFAALWEEAIEAGYVRLETALVGQALGEINAIEPRDSGAADMAPERKIDVDLAIRLLARRGSSSGKGGRPTSRALSRHVATEEETDAALLKKLAVLRRQLAKQS